ncbi:anthranilate phosphoribosyltransferase [Actinoplanes teichomyceticus]|uniref:Anthranilate phosphoribosyltransferase n=1 Tax=Actinoplanes teichomyceticus TaxID=1867 RepID=A0A561WIR6_ACTTI|nr:anthranilate phosphoribosyltransferase [Actinoplanes teichomyceticus]TWG23765.1 anthranilate phosphoribosyltransferase [Actinoplanes teichomyceticus]GIF11810.1 anthranilate phosphoribosyltransferase [Actinoplanes teichomyceticus]
MGARTWPNLTSSLLRGEELAAADTAWAMGEIMAGNATPAQIAGFAVALRAKGETPAELAGLVKAMLANATLVELPAEVRARAVDVVGTGGDRANTVNISTMAAIVIASAGVTVVKHGSRSASSTTGTADLLEHLGIPLDLGPAGVSRTVAEAGIGFCFAARYHPGMRHASVTRRELGVPTFFNMLGPLTNPARPASAAVGCFEPRMAPVMAGVFAMRGDSALVMRGEDGLDEFTTAAPTRLWLARDGKVEEMLVDATELGLPRSEPAALRGGDAAFNADVARRVFAGETGPVRDAVLVNAAAAFTAQSGFPGDFRDTMRAGIARAAEAIDSGATTALLERWVAAAQAAKAAE